MKAYDLIAQRAINELRNQKIMPIRGEYILQFDEKEAYPNFMDIRLVLTTSIWFMMKRESLLMSFCLRTSPHIRTRKDVVIKNKRVIESFKYLQSESTWRERAAAQQAFENTDFDQEQ